jgi:hypothetical protein
MEQDFRKGLFSFLSFIIHRFERTSLLRCFGSDFRQYLRTLVKTFRCKAREVRRSQAYSGVRRSEADERNAAPGRFHQRAPLGIVTVEGTHVAKMAGIPPCLQEPVTLLVTEHVQSRVGEFKPARRVERN